jgi:hypothetical protein
LVVAAIKDLPTTRREDLQFENVSKALAEQVPDATARTVSTGQELIEALKQETATTGAIKNLVIYSHSGAPGVYMEVGKGLYRNEEGYFGEGVYPEGATVAEVAKEVRAGSIVFAKNALVVFAGCNCAGQSESTHGRETTPAVRPQESIAHELAERVGVITIGSYGGSEPLSSKAQGVSRRSLEQGWFRFDPKETSDGTHRVEISELGLELRPAELLRSRSSQ